MYAETENYFLPSIHDKGIIKYIVSRVQYLLPSCQLFAKVYMSYLVVKPVSRRLASSRRERKESFMLS